MFIVRFTRFVTEDLDVARGNFPHLDPTLQLLEQFKMELCENRRLRGLWTTLSHYDNYDDQPRQGSKEGVLYVWVCFEWKGTIMTFVREMQRTFDECGMNGSFNLLDGITSNGAIYSRDDIVVADKSHKAKSKSHD